MPEVRIREVGVNELGLLLCWREEVLRCVFSLIGCALERNITKIYLETSPCGRALYEAAGFSEMRDMMLLTYGK